MGNWLYLPANNSYDSFMGRRLMGILLFYTTIVYLDRYITPNTAIFAV